MSAAECRASLDSGVLRREGIAEWPVVCSWCIKSVWPWTRPWACMAELQSQPHAQLAHLVARVRHVDGGENRPELRDSEVCTTRMVHLKGAIRCSTWQARGGKERRQGDQWACRQGAGVGRQAGGQGAGRAGRGGGRAASMERHALPAQSRGMRSTTSSSAHIDWNASHSGSSGFSAGASGQFAATHTPAE